MDPVARRVRPQAVLVGFVASLVLAGVSLLAPLSLNFDAWAWLVWGRELIGLDLITAGGPSWKPLPSLVGVPLSLFGDGAPDAWMLIVRSGWVLSIALTALVGLRLMSGSTESRIPGGSLTAVAVFLAAALLLERFRTAGWILAATGLSEPLLAALLLAAFLAHVEQRPGIGVGLTFLACLIRPESWVILLLLAFAYRRSLPGGLLSWVGMALAILLLWFLPDFLANGEALAGPDRARASIDANPLPLVAERLIPMPLVAFWPLAGWAVWCALRHGERATLEFASAGAAWLVTVGAMAVIGFAALPRFMLPVAFVVAILGSVGALDLVARARAALHAGAGTGRTRVVVLAATITLGSMLAVDAGWRLSQWPGDVERYVTYDQDQEQILAVAQARIGVPERCRLLSVQGQHLSAVVWELDLAFDQTIPFGDIDEIASVGFVQGPADAITFAGVPIEPPPADAELVGSVGDWGAFERGCGG